MSGPREAAYGESLALFARPRGPDLLARTEQLLEWADARRAEGVWPYSRSLEAAPRAEAQIRDDEGNSGGGLNFASQDYLGLAAHPAVHEAALAALRDFGTHSAGSGVLFGNTRLSLALERALAEHLETEHVLLFPTGWGAGFGAIVALVRPYDYVVMDALAHACLQQGAYAATPKVLRHDHLDVDAAREQIEVIRREDATGGILVITEGLFSMDSDSPRLEQLQATCRELGATLLVDVAHDLGALGPGGTGQLGIQQLLGKVDLVMGSFSKTFASNGGFIATHSRAVRQFAICFGGSLTFSNALSPLQAAVVLEALRIVRSDEGQRLRNDLSRVVAVLRAAFAARGIDCLGEPSAVVPVPVGSEPVARLASRLLAERGVLANLIEFPAVAVGAARFRMQVMATHTDEQASHAAALAADTIADARSRF